MWNVSDQIKQSDKWNRVKGTPCNGGEWHGLILLPYSDRWNIVKGTPCNREVDDTI